MILPPDHCEATAACKSESAKWQRARARPRYAVDAARRHMPAHPAVDGAGSGSQKGECADLCPVEVY